MALIVNNNPASIAAQRNLSVNTLNLNRSVERLSSGLRVTRAADDAAGLGLSESLRAQIRSINQATRNASDGISLTQIADGAAATIGSLLARLRELSSQSASGTVGNTERSYIDLEFVALRSEIDRIAQVTEFNGQALTSGSSISFSIAIGFRSGTGNTLSLNLNDITTTSLGLASVNVSTSANASSALANIDNAISAVARASIMPVRALPDLPRVEEISYFLSDDFSLWVWVSDWRGWSRVAVSLDSVSLPPDGRVVVRMPHGNLVLE